MAVIPGGSHPVPDGAKQSGADLALVQNLTEDDVRNNIKGQALLPWESAHGSFFTNIIGGIGQALLAGVTGAANTIGGWVSDFFNVGRRAAYGDERVDDGQLSLSERADLLSPLLNYGSAYCPANNLSDRIMTGAGVFPFTELLGYHHNVRIRDGGGLVLEEKGTWNIEGSVTCQGRNISKAGSVIASTAVTIYVDVIKPDGSVWSRAIKKMPISGFGSTIGVATQNVTFPSSYDFKFTVQVPDPGYAIKVEAVRAGAIGYDNNFGWSGTEQCTRLTAQCMSVDYDSSTASNAPTDPNIPGES